MFWVIIIMIKVMIKIKFYQSSFAKLVFYNYELKINKSLLNLFQIDGPVNESSFNRSWFYSKESPKLCVI